MRPNFSRRRRIFGIANGEDHQLVLADLPGFQRPLDPLTDVYSLAAVLYHFESRSRVAGICPDEIEFIQARWAHRLADDPFTPALT